MEAAQDVMQAGQIRHISFSSHNLDVAAKAVASGLFELWPQALFRDPTWWFTQAALSGKKCIECGTCEPRCPYKLPIREMIKENVAFMERVTAG